MDQDVLENLSPYPLLSPLSPLYWISFFAPLRSLRPGGPGRRPPGAPTDPDVRD